MFKILMNTPFGFVLELPGNTPYQQAPYELILNGEIFLKDNRNIISVFGLLPDTNYRIEILGPNTPLILNYRTEKAGYIINVLDYAARGNGVQDDTSAINAAIYTAPKGSIVRFPKGKYMVNHILLKSGVDIYLEDGAELCQLPNRETLAIIKGYQKNYDHTEALVGATWEGNPLDCYISLIYGRDVENICIYGNGTLNGNGNQGDWWVLPKIKKNAWRPRNIFLAYCKNITVAGITSRNSASWNIHPFYSDKLKFYCLNIESEPSSPNTDGLNPESCSVVTIAGCRFAVGDDCIAIKSGKIYMSRHHYKPSCSINIRNCLMEQGHGAVVIGSEIACGVRNVKVESCLFLGSDRGLRVKTRRGRGDTSIVENISFRNVEMRGVPNCFTVNMYYHCDIDGHSDYVQNKAPLPVTDETPVVRGIVISGVKASEISNCAVFIYGLPESPVQNIKIEKSSFSFLQDREVNCPDMLDGWEPIDNLGVYMQNIKEETIVDTIFEGSYIAINESSPTTS